MPVIAPARITVANRTAPSFHLFARKIKPPTFILLSGAPINGIINSLYENKMKASLM
jgi:hypothetical protein